MKIIVGLGNPGERYEKTRHNLGFMVLEQFLKDFEPVEKTVWEDSKKFKSEIARLKYAILAKPKTYMNNSGLAVSLISQYLNISISDIWIVHDDIDLSLGGMKIRFGGASAGHKGVASIIKSLGTDKFWRFRLGVGTQKSEIEIKKEGAKMKPRDVDDFVLGEFNRSEQGKAREIIKRGAKALGVAIEEGLETAMNRFNAK